MKPTRNSATRQIMSVAEFVFSYVIDQKTSNYQDYSQL